MGCPSGGVVLVAWCGEGAGLSHQPVQLAELGQALEEALAVGAAERCHGSGHDALAVGAAARQWP
jgi:hypothetical protein